ncbi:hypothetical protein, partial [Enterobacter hormaechei]|uniref:hypothetical protein n=2 Tax=Enterobacter hormaechei TaxID=158836 RepID=UPI001C3ECFCD
MKQFLNFLIYLFFFIIAFTLLKYAEVLEFDEVSRPGIISRFLIALIVLIAVTRWGVNLMNRFESLQMFTEVKVHDIKKRLR